MTTQTAFLLCDASRTVLDALITSVMNRLAEQEATILLYGVTLKRREGFVVLQANRGIPRMVEQELRARSDIFECVVYNAPNVEHKEAEVVPLLLLLGQALMGQESFQAGVVTIRSAVRRLSIAVMREEAALNYVTQACRTSSPEDESLHWIIDACEGAIRELLQVAALWQRIGDDLFACPGVDGTALQYRCLQQRQRVTRRALGIMDIQQEAEQERHTITARKPTEAVEQPQANVETERKEGEL